MIEEHAAPTDPLAADAADSALSPEPPTRTEATTPSLTLEALKPKMELKGVVKRVELFGAFVDVGADRDAFVHISQISEEPPKNVNDVLHEGQAITLWVRQVDTERGRIDATMIKPLGLDWNEIRVGQVLTGKIVRIENYGVFIDVGAERPGMVHVKELAHNFVGSPADVYQVGEELTAKVIKVSSRKKQLDLSVKALEPAPTSAASDEDDDENVPNAIELALRRALLNSADADFPELERVLAGRGAHKTGGRKGKRRSKPNTRAQQKEALSSSTEN
ncbi:MAG: S1 RNA-binding domain-containing protein [Aggregatilineales bacterium]